MREWERWGTYDEDESGSNTTENADGSLEEALLVTK